MVVERGKGPLVSLGGGEGVGVERVGVWGVLRWRVGLDVGVVVLACVV